MHRAAWLISLVVLLGCGRNNDPLPSNILSDSLMVSIVTEMELGKARLKTVKRDSLTMEQLTAHICSKHGSTPIQLNESFQFYSQEPGRLETIYEKVIERLTEQQTVMRNDTTLK